MCSPGLYLDQEFPAFVLWVCDFSFFFLVAQSYLTLCDPHRLLPARLLCPWNSPGKNIELGCHSLLQGIFLIQGLNLGLLHCRWILYWLSHQGNPCDFSYYSWKIVITFSLQISISPKNNESGEERGFAITEGHYNYYTNAKIIQSSQPKLSYLNLTCISHLQKLGLDQKKKKRERRIHFKCSILSLSVCTQFVSSHSDRN